MSLRVRWLPGAQRDLLGGVPHLETILSIDADVERVAATFEDPSFEEPVERFGPRGIRMRVAGRRVVSMLIDPWERTLLVIALGPEPDPDADPNADPEPDEYEDDE